MAWQKRRSLTPEEKESDPVKARAKALELLSGREYASAELYDKLCLRFEEPAAAQAVAEMVERGWVDDARYARTRAHSLLCARKSRRAAAQALGQKGLARAEIETALDEVYAADPDGTDPEREAALGLLRGSLRRRLAEGRRDLVTAALQRRGFSWAVIRAALDEAEAELLSN